MLVNNKQSAFIKLIIIIKPQMFDQQISNKRSQFRNQIRRKQIEQIFAKRRLQIQEQMINEQKEMIMRQLQTAENKRVWIEKKAQQMGREPRKQWFNIIRSLSISAPAYQNDFGDWIRMGIINNLALTFKQEYVYLDLADIAASALSDVFIHLQEPNPQIKQILQCYFIPDLIQLCVPIEKQATYYLQLVNAMIYSDYTIRNNFIDQGLAQVLVQKLRSIKSYDSDEVFSIIMTIYRLVYMREQNGHQLVPKGNIVSIFVPILDTYLLLVKRQQTLGRILKIFCSLGLSEKQHILADLFNCKNLINFCLHRMTVQGNSDFRAAAANVLGCITTSNKKQYAQQMVRRGVLDAILICSKMNNHNICTRNLLQLLSNISLNSLEQARAIVYHDVFPYFIIPCINGTELKQIQLGLYILSNLIYTNNYQINELLLRKYKVLNIFMSQLTKTVPNLKICIQVLNGLCNLIKMYNSVYEGKQNRVTQDLQRFYNISTVLSALQENFENKTLHNRVNNILAALYGQ